MISRFCCKSSILDVADMTSNVVAFATVVARPTATFLGWQKACHAFGTIVTDTEADELAG